MQRRRSGGATSLCSSEGPVGRGRRRTHSIRLRQRCGVWRPRSGVVTCEGVGRRRSKLEQRTEKQARAEEEQAGGVAGSSSARMSGAWRCWPSRLEGWRCGCARLEGARARFEVASARFKGDDARFGGHVFSQLPLSSSFSGKSMQKSIRGATMRWKRSKRWRGVSRDTRGR